MSVFWKSGFVENGFKPQCENYLGNVESTGIFWACIFKRASWENIWKLAGKSLVSTST